MSECFVAIGLRLFGCPARLNRAHIDAQVETRATDTLIESLFTTMFVQSRSLFVPATTTVLLTFLATAPQAAAQTPTPQHIGTAAITHSASRDAGVEQMHIQQQLVRLTGVSVPRDTDVETLVRALEAARTRPVTPERMTALSQALAGALSAGVFEEVTIQRLAEDLFAVLNNRGLSHQQAMLVAVDVGAVLRELEVPEPQTEVVLTALKGVCPSAVAAPQNGPEGTSTTESKMPKRSLLILSRDAGSTE
jgi:hypothetical protein